MEEYLDKKLIEYSKTDTYPFHMPGHKRRILGFSEDFYQMDITEIHGFDDLHKPEGIIKEAQERAADLFGAERSCYLVNGSTCGILSAICGSTKTGDKILMARNCHKSVYHSVLIQQLRPVYLYPGETGWGIQGSIIPEKVKELLEKNPDCRAVVITSPTYDGIVSNVKKIAEIVHERKIPLIVDQAHGAHFGLTDRHPESAIQSGADAVIISLHKTLPAPTQTALLLLNSRILNYHRIEEYLDIFETSSPSYVLMAAMDRCVRMIKEKGAGLFVRHENNLDRFYGRVRDLTSLHVLESRDLSRSKAFDFDHSKIIIFTKKAGIDGNHLAERLREDFSLEMEMVCSSYVMALTSLMDSAEGLERLAEALHVLDEEYHLLHFRKDEMITDSVTCTKKMEIFQAKAKKNEEILLKESEGRVSGGFLIPYPPGIPLAVPGEIINQKVIGHVISLEQKGIRVEGILPKERIIVVQNG